MIQDVNQHVKKLQYIVENSELSFSRLLVLFASV